MIYALCSIASVQSLGFAANVRASVPAAQMRLALRGDDFDRGSSHGNFLAGLSDALPDTAPGTIPDLPHRLDDRILRINLERLSLDRLCRAGLRLRLRRLLLWVERLLPLFFERSEFLGFRFGFQPGFKGGFMPGFSAALLKQSESQLFRQCGRAIWQFSAESTPC
ncbi:hypothetical protein [Leptolyngbya ohadii]|uniref:hypothetical protein n=1 Tax=Leptolyngbya ohadii TaxID=1962290 RepID=UPI00117B25FD|nr:hypothetical protein [Leptolyngbya ohadii]